MDCGYGGIVLTAGAAGAGQAEAGAGFGGGVVVNGKLVLGSNILIAAESSF